MSKRTDISQQIIKYLNGELDARAMHQLERQAQDDPFLRDALEGYEIKGIDHDKKLKELASWLENRIAKKERRIIPIRFIATAAAVLIFLFAGLLWYINRPLVIEKQVAKAKSTPEVKKPAVDTLLVPAKKTEIATLTKKKPHHKRLIPQGESMASYTPPPVSEIAPATQVNPNADLAVEKSITHADAKVTEAEPKQFKPDSNYFKGAAKYSNNSLNEVAIGVELGNKEIINGLVTAKDDGLPIPGVTIKVKGTNIATQTNTVGKFSLAVPKGATLVFAFIGYATQMIPASTKDLKVVLQPAGGSLAEVVITQGYNDRELQPAHPENGWKDFNKYLKNNAKSPDGKTGVVKLSFIVNANGSLSDFKIKKSLGSETDSFAIQLIQNGPAWVGKSNNKPKKITVKIRFEEKQ